MSELTPISNIQTPRVTTNLETLPFLGSPTRIGIDLTEAEKLCNISGIGHLHISTTDTAVPERNPESDLFRHKAHVGLTNLSTYISTKPVDFERKPKEAVWANTTLLLTTDSIAQKIVQDPETRSVRNASSWAHYLNQEIKAGIFTSARDHLTKADIPVHNLQEILSGINIVDSYLWMVSIHPLQFLTQTTHPHLPTIPEILTIGLLKCAALQAGVYASWRNSRKNLEPEELGFRLSMFGPHQYDRLLFLMATSPFTTVVDTQ